MNPYGKADTIKRAESMLFDGYEKRLYLGQDSARRAAASDTGDGAGYFCAGFSAERLSDACQYRAGDVSADRHKAAQHVSADSRAMQQQSFSQEQ